MNLLLRPWLYKRTSDSSSNRTLHSSSALITTWFSSRSSMMKLCLSFMVSRICFTAESLYTTVCNQMRTKRRHPSSTKSTDQVRRTPETMLTLAMTLERFQVILTFNGFHVSPTPVLFPWASHGCLAQPCLQLALEISVQSYVSRSSSFRKL